MELKSRRTVRWAITENPSKEFVKQRLELVKEEIEGEDMVLIHDNAPQFTTIDYESLGIESAKTGYAAPDMNAFMERTIGSFRREALDHFLIFSERQVHKIIEEYVDYYNHLRPHQGINRIPDRKGDFGGGAIHKKKILGGLHHHYYRDTA